jgi:hypothetical protein
MRRWSAVLVLSWLLFVPAVASAADLSFDVEGPRFPTPFVTAILGLTLTAVVVVGARACVRSPNVMMYMVLSTVALTAVLVAYADRVHSDFRDAGLQRLAELEREYQALKAK